MKRLACLPLIFVLASASAVADVDWRLRVKKDGEGWTAQFSSANDYGSGRHRIKGSGQPVEKSRALPAFSRLRLEGPVDVRLTQGAAERATVVADDNVEPLVETVVEGDSLVVRLKRDTGFTTRQAPVVRLEAKTVQAVTVDASGDLTVERLKGEGLTLGVSGSGDVRLGLVELQSLDVVLSGSGDVRAAGRAEQQQWKVSGSGDVDARSLGGRAAQVAISGSGDVALGVTEQIDARLSGSGDLSYAGRPELRQRVSGSGEIRRR